MAIQGRRARLLLEYEKLINLEKRSDFIDIEPINMIEGMPPEDYLITFKCRGIAGLNEDQSPQFTEFHQVSMKLSSNFPNQEPFLKWLTPIWHPNIEHKEPHHVCTNNVQNWFSTKSLDDLVTTLGEMVQYQRYHAAWVAPFPLDKEAADWVVQYAEPKGLIGPEKPIDDRQILRPKKTKLHGSPPIPPKRTGRLKLGAKKVMTVSHERRTTQEIEVPDQSKPLASAAANTGNSPGENPAQPVRRRGITLGLRTRDVQCRQCSEVFSNPNVGSPADGEFVCDKCRNQFPIKLF